MVFVDLMIFDFDGTLVDSGKDIVASVNFTLQALGMPGRPYEEVVGFIGDGVRTLIERSLGPEKEDLYPRALEVFIAHYRDHLLEATCLYPGADDVLRHFKDKKKWIVTNKAYEFTVKIASAVGIQTFFEGIIGRDSLPYAKPDARVLQRIMEKHQVRKERTVVIGDGRQDIRMAKNAGVWGCACLGGLGNRETLLQEHPDFSCESIVELKAMFS